MESSTATTRQGIGTAVVNSTSDCAAYENYAGREPEGYAEFCTTDKSLLNEISSAGIKAPTDTGYAQDIGFISDNFVSFALNNFTGQSILGTSTNAYYGMDFDPSGTTLYALEDTTGQLGTINVANGAFTPLVAAPAPGGSWSGLSIDPTDGTFYASTPTGLYTLNPATGVSTLVGNFTGTTLMIDIAVGPDGTMYGHAIDTDSIYTINKATGANTLVGLTGQNANFAQGMDFDNGDGTLYIFLYIGSGANVYGTVNLGTGGVTPLATSAPQGEFEGAIPVPGSAGPTDWAYTLFTNATVAPGETAVFDVVFDATSLYVLGDYTADLSFSGNFNNMVPTMPLTMHLSCPTCGILDGVITDADTGDPLVADINVTGPNSFDVTVMDSSYQLAVPSGDYDFTVSANGYLSQTVIITATSGVTVTTDFALRPAQANISVDPQAFDVTLALGNTATYPLDIINDGAVGTDFELSEQSVISWLSTAPITGTVAADSTVMADVMFDTTVLTQTGVYNAVLQVLTDDPVNPSINVPITLTVTAAPVYGVALTPATDATSGNLGDVVTYTLTITNDGNMADTFDLAASGNANATTLSQNSVALAAGASTTVEVYVTVPAGANDGDFDVVTITATSQGDPGQSAASVLTTTAVDPTYYLYLPIIMKP